MYEVGKTTKVVTTMGAIFEFVQNSNNKITAIVGKDLNIAISGSTIFDKMGSLLRKNANKNPITNEIEKAIKLLKRVNSNAI